MKIWLVIVLLLLCASCGGNNNDDEVLSEVLSGDYGVIKSLDVSVISLDSKFNSKSNLQRGAGTLLEVELKVKGRYVDAEPSEWSLVIRMPPDSVGSTDVRTLDVRLFSNYSDECCLNSDDPIGKYEKYSQAFVAIEGTINFVTPDEAEFDLFFREENPGRSSNAIGDIVNIIGCWKSGGEGAPTGCAL